MQQLQQTLSEQMRINDHEIERRKVLLNFIDEDADTLKHCLKWVEPFVDAIVARFYVAQTQLPEISLVIGDKETLSRLHVSMAKYTLELFSGLYDQAYVDKRLRIGKIHHRIGVSPKLYLSGINQLQLLIEEVIAEQAHLYNQSSQDITLSLRKLFYFDNQLVFDTYIASLQIEVESANQQLELYAHNLENVVAKRTAELTDLSMKDALTGLYNQRAFYELLEKSFNITERCQQHLTLLYIDINFFKEVNDTHGHKAGDEVLVGFAQSATQIIRKMDFVSRYGGDEFCIVLPNTKIEEAKNLCLRLIELFDKSSEHPVTLSIGGASLYPGSKLSMDKLIIAADNKMYQAKQICHETCQHHFELMPRDELNVTRMVNNK